MADLKLLTITGLTFLAAAIGYPLFRGWTPTVVNLAWGFTFATMMFAYLMFRYPSK